MAFSHSNQPHRSSSHTAQPYRSSKRKKKAQRQRLITLLVFVVLILILLIVALLLSRNSADTPASSVSSVSVPAASSTPDSTPDASSLPASSVAEPVSSAPMREPTPWDEEGIPALYNYENFIPDGYLSTIELIDVGGGHRMEKRAGEAFLAMADAALQDGITLVRISGYRAHEHQANNYNASIQRYLNQGLPEAQAIALTQGWYAIPGTSEHEAGVAMDVGDANNPGTNIDESFRDTPTYAWLQENCTRFGFILRYLEEDFDITHIHSEPWHYRYVGANHAEAITEQGLTLEEYVANLQAQ